MVDEVEFNTYKNYMESIVQYVIAQEINKNLGQTVMNHCSGCDPDNFQANQLGHTCLMRTVSENISIYFEEILLNLDIEKVLQKISSELIGEVPFAVKSKFLNEVFHQDWFQKKIDDQSWCKKLEDMCVKINELDERINPVHE